MSSKVFQPASSKLGIYIMPKNTKSEFNSKERIEYTLEEIKYKYDKKGGIFSSQYVPPTENNNNHCLKVYFNDIEDVEDCLQWFLNNPCDFKAFHYQNAMMRAKESFEKAKNKLIEQENIISSIKEEYDIIKLLIDAINDLKDDHPEFDKLNNYTKKCNELLIEIIHNEEYYEELLDIVKQSELKYNSIINKNKNNKEYPTKVPKRYKNENIDVNSIKVKSDPIISDKIISDKVISDKIISDKIISDKIISDKIISDPITSDPITSDPIISDPIISDPIISEQIISGQIKSDKVNSKIIEIKKESDLAEIKTILINLSIQQNEFKERFDNMQSQIIILQQQLFTLMGMNAHNNNSQEQFNEYVNHILSLCVRPA
jgi:hypothetical protein